MLAPAAPETDDDALEQWSESEWSFLAVPECRSALSALVRCVARGDLSPECEVLRAGRGFIVVAPLGSGSRVVVRPYRRGGWVRLVSERRYWGFSPRSFRELQCLVALRGRAVPVVEPVGAAVRWRGWWSYEAWLVTRYVEQSHTLWSWFQAQPQGDERAAVLDTVGRGLAQLHRSGAQHRDLNLHNVLVRCVGGRVGVWFVDLDGVVLRSSQTDPRRSLARMRRSARKLDPGARYITAADWHRLEAAVHQHWSE